MNFVRNSLSVLSHLLPHKPTAVSLLRSLLAQARYYYASRVPRGNANASRQPPQVPSHRSFFTSRWWERLLFLQKFSRPRGIRRVVPYTNRSHFIIVPQKLERKLGQFLFDCIKEEMGSNVLPPLHPDSVRVRRIASEIVGAIDRSLADRQRHDDHGEEALGTQPQTSRLLDGWDVMVVKYDKFNAGCLPGGKILVFTGLLDKCRDDAEIATVLGHEIGHAIARHTAEGFTNTMCRFILHFVTLKFIYRPGVMKRAMRAASRRMEMEADHIGLLLLAAAGYDPRVAPLVYEKLAKIDDSPYSIQDTHPSPMERAQFVSQADLMNQALELYRGVRPCPNDLELTVSC